MFSLLEKEAVMLSLLALLNQFLFVTTMATALVTVGMMPRWVRKSRLDGMVLLVLVALAGAIAFQQFHDFWPGAVFFLPGLSWLLGSRDWKAWARIYVTCVLQNALVYLFYLGEMVLHSSGVVAFIIGGIIWLAQTGSVIVTFPFTFDLLNVLGRKSYPARDHMLAAPEPERWLGCCFQIPVYNEPPELLAKVIKQLMLQDYPGPWMIQVIDNNTPDLATWLPIQELCWSLGERVQFLHLENWPGFKAGALNEGTRQLPDWVELIAIVDADYLVNPDFLRATARHFVDERVAFVQTPQHYREWQGQPYFEGLCMMYETFFATYMTSRREMNGIICAGTMGIVRRSHLEQVGFWDEESVTEDAELSIRLLGRGRLGIYDHRSYGAGLMPFEFGALKRQRFRWAFGTAQLLKKHWRPLFGFPSKEGYRLTFGQRLCYYGLGFQYMIEVVSFLSALLLVVDVGLPYLGWNLTIPSLQTAVIVPFLLIAINLIRTVWGLREATSCKLAQAVGAFLFFFALSWVTFRACVAACIHQRGVFLRTPKVRESQKWQRALHITTQEITLSLFFLGVAILTIAHHPTSVLPIGLLAFQACVYGMSSLCALAAEGVWLLPSWLLGTRQQKAADSELGMAMALLLEPDVDVPSSFSSLPPVGKEAERTAF
jgi:cellulose synthase/poly-beta-1,6-N-acetylglucosamine synthase-like glycosyltransferase